MPLASRASAMNAASTTKVAPCRACAGPNTAPRNEWAIMMWSRTSTMNKGDLSRIADELAEYAAPGFQDIGKTRRKFAEREGWRQQSVELRIGAELDRGFEPLAMGERSAMRGRHLADLARHDLQAAAVERAAERHRDGPRSVPTQLDEGHLDAFDLRTEKPDQRPDDACAEDRDASGRAWRRVPCGVQCCLNVGR